MERKILIFGSYFDDFMAGLDDKTRLKIKQGLLILATQKRIPVKYTRYIRDGLFELRTEWESNIYRVFFIFDKGNLVVLFNGFQKKTQKTPENEIKKALKIKKEYYESKQ